MNEILSRQFIHSNMNTLYNRFHCCVCRHGFLVHDWLDMIHDSFITKQRRKFADLILYDCLYFRKLVFFSVNFFLRANFHFSIKCPSFPSSDTQVQMVGRGKVGMGEEK